MTHSVLCIASSPIPRIIQDPSRPEHALSGRSALRKRVLFTSSSSSKQTATQCGYYFAHSMPPNYPHKLTKTAEPWLGGGAALGGSELHARVTSAAVRSCHCVVSRGSRRAALLGPARWAAFAA